MGLGNYTGSNPGENSFVLSASIDFLKLFLYPGVRPYELSLQKLVFRLLWLLYRFYLCNHFSVISLSRNYNIVSPFAKIHHVHNQRISDQGMPCLHSYLEFLNKRKITSGNSLRHWYSQLFFWQVSQKHRKQKKTLMIFIKSQRFC